MWNWNRIDTGLSTKQLIEILNRKLKELEGDTGLRGGPYFDGRDYGIGSSVGDNSKGLQAAYDDVFARGGGRLVFPPFADSLDFSTEVLGRPKVSLQGAGEGVTVLNSTGVGRGLVLDAGAAIGQYWQSSLSDFTLMSHGAVYPYLGTDGLTLDDVNTTKTTRVEITGWGHRALILKGDFTCLSHIFDTVDIHENQGGVETAGANGTINHINFVNSRIRASQEWNLYNILDVRSWAILGCVMEAGVVGSVYMKQFIGFVLNAYFEQINGASAVVLGDTGPNYAMGLQMFGCGLQGMGAGAGGTAVKIGVGGGQVFGSVVNNFFGGWLVGINKAGLQPDGDYTTGNNYMDVTTPTV